MRNMKNVSIGSTGCRKLLPVIFFTIFLISCSGESDNGSKSDAAPVRVTEVRQQSAPRTLHAVGNASASASVAIVPRVSGEIIAVNFTEGQDVKEGQALLQIDPRPYEAIVKEKKGALARSEAQYAKALEDRRRYQKLVGNGYVSRESFEQISTDAAALQATVISDRAAVENAMLDLSYCTVKAPISGRVGGLKIHKGNMIKSGSTESIVDIDCLEPCYVNFSVPEKNLPLLQAQLSNGQVNLHATPQGGEAQSGHLTLIDNNVDTKTGSIPLRGTFPNASRQLWPGQYVDVTLTLGQFDNALIVPAKAIQTGRDESYVYVVNDKKQAEYRKVKVIFSNNGESVIEGDVKPGEKVVIYGQVRLFPDAPVRIL